MRDAACLQVIDEEEGARAHRRESDVQRERERDRERDVEIGENREKRQRNVSENDARGRKTPQNDPCHQRQRNVSDNLALDNAQHTPHHSDAR
jgi:hypothetical protein